ncbi:hypothetical protein ABZV58_21705 [Nocardia sp. NPDC004654]|uniref:hypothetical protein n=1 Tax=Nocardia sp. NPDC004654 TaxID=3154776 RepID=UPI00339E644C
MEQFHFDPDDVRRLADTFATTTSMISVLGKRSRPVDGVTYGLVATRVVEACDRAITGVFGAALAAAAGMQALGDATSTTVTQFLSQDGDRAAEITTTGLDLP